MFRKRRQTRTIPGLSFENDEMIEEKKNETVSESPSPMEKESLLTLSERVINEGSFDKEKPCLQTEELRNLCYYIGSIIPKKNKWNCHFVDSHHHKGDYTVAKNSHIEITATLNGVVDIPILLPFGEDPVFCHFPSNVEFSFVCDKGEGILKSVHVCEEGVHKLILPEEVNITGIEYNIRDLCPLRLRR